VIEIPHFLQDNRDCDTIETSSYLFYHDYYTKNGLPVDGILCKSLEIRNINVQDVLFYLGHIHEHHAYSFDALNIHLYDMTLAAQENLTGIISSYFLHLQIKLIEDDMKNSRLLAVATEIVLFPPKQVETFQTEYLIKYPLIESYKLMVSEFDLPVDLYKRESEKYEKHIQVELLEARQWLNTFEGVDKIVMCDIDRIDDDDHYEYDLGLCVGIRTNWPEIPDIISLNIQELITSSTDLAAYTTLKRLIFISDMYRPNNLDDLQIGSNLESLEVTFHGSGPMTLGRYESLEATLKSFSISVTGDTPSIDVKNLESYSQLESIKILMLSPVSVELRLPVSISGKVSKLMLSRINLVSVTQISVPYIYLALNNVSGLEYLHFSEKVQFVSVFSAPRSCGEVAQQFLLKITSHIVRIDFECPINGLTEISIEGYEVIKVSDNRISWNRT
jgi:hypothetical protein